MADVKISALPTATTPLAGTEVLPIVQSATTKQVAVSDLTTGRAISASSLTLTTPLSAANGGTGNSSYTTGDILYASGATALSKLADVATGNALISGGVGTAPSWGKIGLTTHVSGTLPVANGGTGITSFGTGVATALGNNTNAASGLITLDANQNASIGGTLAMGSSFLRNRIINGGFSIDQRNLGVSQTITAAAALAYTVDRWYAYCTGANVTGQQITGTAPAKNAYKFTGATSNTLVGFGQRIEQLNSYDMASGAVTISVYMTTSTNTTITWYLYGPSSTADTFGTIASPSVTQIATGTFSVTSTRTQFTTTISAASMSGFNKGLELRFVAASGLGNGVTWTIEDCQIEVGSAATSFERRQYGEELMLCQRYLPAYNGSGAMGTAWVTSTTNAYVEINHPVQTRAATTGLTSSAASTFQVYTTAAVTKTGTAIAFNAGGTIATRIALTVADGLTQGQATAIYANSSTSQILFTGAEL